MTLPLKAVGINYFKSKIVLEEWKSFHFEKKRCSERKSGDNIALSC